MSVIWATDREPSGNRLRKLLGPWLLTTSCFVWAPPARAHFFVQSYTLPIPFGMYAWSASLSIVLSFILLAAVVRSSGPVCEEASLQRSTLRFVIESQERTVRGVSLALLLLCIASGLAGTQSAYENFNMTFVWVICVVVLPYSIALFGDFYDILNPWKTLVELSEFIAGRGYHGFLPMHEGVRYWPAIVAYMAFVYIELFSQVSPFNLSMFLIAYAVVNLVGAWTFGKDAWFRYGEFFGVMLRWIGKLAPVSWMQKGKGADARVEISLRVPLQGMTGARADDMSHVLFILFMLSSTGFDGVHGTLPWVNLYWANVDPHLVAIMQLSGREQLRFSAAAYLVWQKGALLISPVLYLMVLAGIAAMAKYVSSAAFGVREMILRLAPTLVPIALAYHVAHYFMLAFSQGGQIVRLISDPLGRGWNLFGTSGIEIAPVMFELGTIWHLQVGLILLGHIAAVYLAHMDAMAAIPNRTGALKAQLPVLLLMVLFTTMGLWILSLPLAPGQ